eukprot:jgi/Tetstr1/435169/TSEL_002625.t1
MGATTNGEHQSREPGSEFRGPLGWIRLKFFQLEVTTGTYMLEPWEKVVYYVFMSAILLLTAYGLSCMVTSASAPQR